jgi:hypothetical protein
MFRLNFIGLNLTFTGFGIAGLSANNNFLIQNIQNGLIMLLRAKLKNGSPKL